MSEKIVQLNEEVIKRQIKELVCGSVEETLNGLLEAEAEKLTQAARYERSEERQAYRSGHYSRNLTTTSGNITRNVPRLKGISFETPANLHCVVRRIYRHMPIGFSRQALLTKSGAITRWPDDERVYIKDSVNAQADRIYQWRQLALCAGWRGTNLVPLHSRQIESVSHSSI